jgi:hypothetical protein
MLDPIADIMRREISASEMCVPVIAKDRQMA